jgi:hypothetical protein
MLHFLKEHQQTGVFDPEALKILSAALDEAWKSVQASGATYETEDERKAVRDMLAKRIVNIAKQGERNSHALARDALTHLAITQGSRRRRI